jgi:hypothetical protein
MSSQSIFDIINLSDGSKPSVRIYNCIARVDSSPAIYDCKESYKASTKGKDIHISPVFPKEFDPAILSYTLKAPIASIAFIKQINDPSPDQ